MPMIFLPTILFWIILLMLGACIGSFIEVILEREAHHDRSWLTGRSRCDACRAKIAWYDNIPLLSYWILRGQCRSCHTQIALQNWYMEAIFGLIFTFWGWLSAKPLFYSIMIEGSYGNDFLINLAVSGLYLGILICLGVIGVIDWRQKEIPDSLMISISALAGGVIVLDWLGMINPSQFSLGINSLSSLLWRVGALVITGLIFYIIHLVTGKIYKKDAFGLGDVKFLALSAFLLGWPGILVMIIISFGLGSIFGLIQILFKKAQFRSEIPLGPFLCIGLVLAFLLTPLISNWINLDIAGTLTLLQG